MQYIYCMSSRLALILTALVAVPSLASATAEEEVVSAVRSRLDAVRRNDAAAWSKFVADDMMAPLEGALPSKQGWIRQHESWPREVTSETTFFVPGEAAGGDSSRIIFVKDDSGRVTHYIYHERGATDRIVRKVK